MTPKPPHPSKIEQAATDMARKFTLTVHDDGSRLRPWTGSVTHGIFYVGEAGSTVYRSTSRTACVRKMMRTVARVAASEGLDEITVRIGERA